MFNWINVSGGKDSTALALWTIESGLENCRYIFADTQFEHEATYEYLNYLESKLGISIERVWTEGMLGLCVRKQRFPSVKARFCTTELKVIPLAKYMDANEEHDGNNPHMVFTGIRREESPNRARMGNSMFNNVKYPPRKVSFQIVHHPIIEWYVDDVFDIMKRHGVEPNPLYKMGMRRVGCLPCIMANRAELKKIFKTRPEVIDRIESMEAQVSAASRIGSATFFSTCDYPNGIRNVAAMLDDGPEIPGLEQDVSGCMSIYGLCE